MCSNFAMNGERESTGAEDRMLEEKGEGDSRPTREPDKFASTHSHLPIPSITTHTVLAFAVGQVPNQCFIIILSLNFQ